MKKNSHETKASTSAKKGYSPRIAVIIGTGIILIFAELLFLPKLLPKPITFTQKIHGDLISPPSETNVTATVRVPPMQRPLPWSVPINAVSGPRANVNPPETETVGGYLQIGFDRLACFDVKVINLMVTPRLNRPIPDFIKAYDNRKVAVRGFMLPLKLDHARVTEFVLMRSRAFCCFGRRLEINEVAYVRMKGDGVKSIMDQPLTVYGTLHVGEIRRNGQINGIYELDGEKMDEPTDFR